MGKLLLILGQWGLLVLLAGGLAGCGDDFDFLPEASTQGSELTQKYPGIVLVQAGHESCTGTFVSRRAVLTASHCTPPDSDVHVTIRQTHFFTLEPQKIILKPQRVIRHGSGVRGDTQDIALLVFAHSSVPLDWVIPIGRSVSTRDLVRLVGYGKGDDQTNAKRTGTNLVFSVRAFIEVVSAPIRAVRGAHNRVGAAAGDSGGPMLKIFGEEPRVVGTVHGGYQWRGRDITEFVNVSSGPNFTWLQTKNAEERLEIRGLD